MNKMVQLFTSFDITAEGRSTLLKSVGTLPSNIKYIPYEQQDTELIQIDTNVALSDNNTYTTWWENKTGNWEIFLRLSSDNGQTFGDEINLSNDSTRSDDGNIAALGNSVYATWWNTNNQTGLREPIFIASDDNGATFGERIRLSGNETTVAVGPSL